MSFSIQSGGFPGGGAPSPEQIRAYRQKFEAQAFDAADSDKSGAVSKTEFAAVRPKDAPANAPSADDVFAKIDSDGDGSITKSEFSTFGNKLGSEVLGKLASLQGSGGLPPQGPPPGKAAQAYGGQASLVSLLGNASSQSDTGETTIAELLKAALTTKTA